MTLSPFFSSNEIKCRLLSSLGSAQTSSGTVCGHLIFGNVRKSLEFRRKSSEVGGTFPEILVMTRWKSHAFDSQKVRRNNIGLKIVRRPRKTVPDFISVKTCNCLCNALILSSHSEERKFEIIGHLQQMVHDTNEFYSKIIKKIWLFRVLLLR